MNTRSRLFHLYPLIPFALCLILGIIIGQLLQSSVSLEARLSAVAISFIVCFVLGKHPRFQTYSILVVSILIGSVLIGIAERDYKTILPCGKVSYEAVVASEPVERGKTVRFDMLVSSGPLHGRMVRASLLKDTVERRYETLGVGDGLVVYSSFTHPKNFGNSNFDYVTYLKAQGISAQTFIYDTDWRKASVSLTRLSVWQRARLSFLCYRHSLINLYRSFGLDGQNLAVIAAMTLGHKSYISDETRDAYSIAGVSHVLALSGMHLSVIYILLSFLFLNNRRFALLRETLLVSAIWVYVFLVGMSPSVVRSALMITVYSIVSLTGRDPMSLNVLAFAAMLMLVVNPFCLYDVGFQLSYVSVAAILIVNRSIGSGIMLKFKQRSFVVRWLLGVAIMSCAAQLATAPLVAYYFGRLPVYFLFTNVVVSLMVIAILYLSAAAFLSFFVPVVQHYIVVLLLFVTDSLNSFLFSISSLPCSSIDGIHINTIQLIAIYVVIVCIFLLFRILSHDGKNILADCKSWFACTMNYGRTFFRRKGVKTQSP